MNLATKLTLLRVVAIPFFIVCFINNSPGESLVSDWGKVIATVIFILAAITDYYDGYLARRYKQVTTFGKFIDPIADKLLVAAALIVMVEYRQITHTESWVAICILGREFAVNGLRLICAEKGKVIAASSAGKIKTATQLTAIITSLCFLSFRIIFETYDKQDSLNTLENFDSIVIWWLMLFAAVTSIYSGYDYFKKNRQFLA